MVVFLLPKSVICKVLFSENLGPVTEGARRCGMRFAKNTMTSSYV